MDLKHIEKIDIEGEIFDMGYITMKTGDTYYFKVISKEEFDKVIDEERKSSRIKYD